MSRSAHASGFSRNATPVASPRLVRAVAASLIFAMLSMCLSVAIVTLSIKISLAMPALS